MTCVKQWAIRAICERARRLGTVDGEWLGKEVAGPEAAQPMILFLHGGGYVRGSLALGRIDASELAELTGMPVFAVAYRQAPEHRFPAAIDDAAEAYAGLLAQGFAGGRIVVVGDSAGGGMAFSLAMRARDRGWPMPAGLVAISPFVDRAFTGASFETNAGKDLITREMGERMLALYVDAADGADPMVSPVQGCLDGLPPSLLIAGQNELLLSSVEQLAERAAAAGVATTLHRYAGMPHGFTKFRTAAASEAMERAAAWIAALGANRRLQPPGW
ncbi:MAG TPA: alpha/beta hydrolase [Variovorax sp.]